VETQLEELTEWATVHETIDQHKEALRMARRTDSRLSGSSDTNTRPRLLD